MYYAISFRAYISGFTYSRAILNVVLWIVKLRCIIFLFNCSNSCNWKNKLTHVDHITIYLWVDNHYKRFREWTRCIRKIIYDLICRNVLLAESADDLQLGLNFFQEYCEKWKLKLNIDKTKVMIFSKGAISRNFKFTFQERELEIVSEFI